MTQRMALKAAIDLMHVPSQVRLYRAGPLPDDVLTLLRIAGGDEDVENAAALNADRSRSVVQRAATFFIEQILFAPDADSYRVLGAGPRATAAELRRNVALLMRWLHPDMDPQSDRSIFVGRVTAAWNDLKTPERRAAYDDRLRSSEKTRSHHGRGKSRSGRSRRPERLRFARNAQLLAGTDKISFFRRALSILFQRPLQ
ncbi:MAG TPA: DnaJ domain-containing protein [Xanthobacteraceae bacterium]|jgi:hypothetical protein